MKERSKNVDKGIIKNVVMKTARNIIIFDIVVIIFSIALRYFLVRIDVIEDIIMFWKLILGVLLIYNLFLLYAFGSIHIRKEKDKVKAETAERIFRKDDSTVVYPKVFPKKGHFRQRKFFEEELPQIADYYANLYEDGKIQVVAKISDLNKILTIEYISKENFIDSYDVLETTLTDTWN